jgi:hypothetical protein
MDKILNEHLILVLSFLSDRNIRSLIRFRRSSQSIYRKLNTKDIIIFLTILLDMKESYEKANNFDELTTQYCAKHFPFKCRLTTPSIIDTIIKNNNPSAIDKLSQDFSIGYYCTANSIIDCHYHEIIYYNGRNAVDFFISGETWLYLSYWQSDMEHFLEFCREDHDTTVDATLIVTESNYLCIATSSNDYYPFHRAIIAYCVYNNIINRENIVDRTIKKQYIFELLEFALLSGIYQIPSTNNVYTNLSINELFSLALEINQTFAIKLIYKYDRDDLVSRIQCNDICYLIPNNSRIINWLINNNWESSSSIVGGLLDYIYKFCREYNDPYLHPEIYNKQSFAVITSDIVNYREVWISHYFIKELNQTILLAADKHLSKLLKWLLYINEKILKQSPPHFPDKIYSGSVKKVLDRYRVEYEECNKVLDYSPV